jgi:hypothetical protein
MLYPCIPGPNQLPSKWKHRPKAPSRRRIQGSALRLWT